MLKELKKKGVVTLILLLSLVTILTSWHYKLNPLESFSLQFNDINFHLQEKKPNKNILFIAIDEPTVNIFGRWPFNRELIAKTLLKLKHADVILMDMIFSEKSSKKEDEALASALSQTNSICGFFLRHNATQFISESQEEVLSDSALDLLHLTSQKNNFINFISTEHAEMNIETIMSACSLSATFSTFRDKDQLFRRYPTAYYYRNYLYPSLAIQALRLYLDSDIESVDTNTLLLNKQKIISDENGFVRLNYYPRESYTTLSFKNVYEGKYSSDFFKGKIVILGISDVGATDVRATPLGAMNGPLLHYTFISNFLNNELIIEREIYTFIAILIMFFTVITIFNFLKSISLRTISYLSSYMVLYIFSKYLYVSNNYYIDSFYPLITLLLTAIIIEIYAFITNEQESSFIKDAFSSYLSSDLLNELIQNPATIKLGGELKEMSILFSDVRSFTTISEKMEAKKLIKVMNRYFTPMTEAVLENSGMLDKYIGDAVMAFYNAPVDVEEHPKAACKSALEMMDRLAILNREFEKEDLPYFEIGIGINTAKVIVGNMGSSHRFNYTVVGDGVNLASRVEGLNKDYATNILITEFTYAYVKESFLTRRLESVKVKGKEESIMLYELMKDTPKNRELSKKFEEILSLYEADKFVESKEKFYKLYKESSDKTSFIFYEKSLKKINSLDD